MSSGKPSIKDAVRYVPRHVGHHGAYSGYDRLFEYMGLSTARSSFWAKSASWIPKSLRWRLWSMRPQPTQQEGLEAELGAIPWVARGNGHLCHFIYGEDTFFFTPLWKKGANKAVATFHYPPEKLLERVNPGIFGALDAVIIVGDNQRDYFRRFFPEEKIHYCPHHVDTNFFCPRENSEQKAGLRMICVGQLFRDYDVLRRIHKDLRQSGLDCETNIVGPRTLSEHPIAHEDGVKIHSEVNDDEFLRLYQHSTVGVLPLTDATANNALLEMMACGLPIVSTSVGGLPSYVEGSAVQLVPSNDPVLFVDKIRDVVKNPEISAEQGRNNASFARNKLSREKIALLMESIYEDVLAE